MAVITFRESLDHLHPQLTFSCLRLGAAVILEGATQTPPLYLEAAHAMSVAADRQGLGNPQFPASPGEFLLSALLL